MCPTEAQPIEDLWESVGSFSRTCQNVFQLRGQKDESLSTNCQSVVGGGLLLRAITLPYLPCAAPWVEQRPRGQQPAVIAVCCLQCAEVSAEGMPEFASDAVLWEDVGERGNGRAERKWQEATASLKSFCTFKQQLEGKTACSLFPWIRRGNFSLTQQNVISALQMWRLKLKLGLEEGTCGEAAALLPFVGD